MQSKKDKKRLYDIEYRRKNKNKIKKRKKIYYEYIKNTNKYQKKIKEYRKKNKEKHKEYCRQLWYKEQKRKYDEIHRAKVRYDEFWECMILCHKIENKIRRLMPDKYERLKMRGVIQRGIKKRALKRKILFGWNYNY